MADVGATAEAWGTDAFTPLALTPADGDRAGAVAVSDELVEPTSDDAIDRLSPS